jgi:2-amino-4-hydroxy-6-hydroxymethyldihydropteridine diphosphokinase
VKAFIGLGSNLGDREANLRAALEHLAHTPETTVVRASSLYDTEPVGVEEQPHFLNAVAQLETQLSPHQLLWNLMLIERRLGRVRTQRWGPRTLDLDLLLFEDLVLDDDDLRAAAPRAAETLVRARAARRVGPDAGASRHRRDHARAAAEARRASAGQTRLAPLELTTRDAGDRVHGRTVGSRPELGLSDPSPGSLGDARVSVGENRYLVIEGVIGAGKTSLSRMLSDRLTSQLVLEEVEENPFLKDFYRDRARYAFQTQMHFLFSRYQQQRNLRPDRAVQRQARGRLPVPEGPHLRQPEPRGKELALYERLVGWLELDVVRPDVVVYLQASTDTLMERITKRNRSFEKDMDRGYIERLNEAYNTTSSTTTRRRCWSSTRTASTS